MVPPFAGAAVAGLPSQVVACLDIQAAGSSAEAGVVLAAGVAVAVVAAGRWHETLQGVGAGAVTPVVDAAGGREP